MKNKQLVLVLVVFFEAIIIVFLALKLRNEQTLLRTNETLVTNLIKSHLLSETAIMNALNIKLKNGDVATVKRIFQTTISTNVLFLQNGTYGELSPTEREALNIVVKNMADFAK